MHQYPGDSFSKVSAMLEMAAYHHGAIAFSVDERVWPLSAALDSAGPLTWALLLHSYALLNLIESNQNTGGMDGLPLTIVDDEDAPLGKDVMLQPGGKPMAYTIYLLDSCLEHCIHVGMRDLGYSPQEWSALPEEQKIIPMMPYFADLQNRWINERLETGSAAERVQVWPHLLDAETLQHEMKHQPTEEQSHVLRFPSAR